MRKLAERVRRTRPALLARITLTALLLAPVWMAAAGWSFLRASGWAKPRRCRRLLERHRSAFPPIRPATLRVRPVSGGVSNAGFIWEVRTADGRLLRYFVKVFLPLGSLWARILPRVSPFPRIEAVSVPQRLRNDAFAREQLEDRGIPVPGCTALDPGAGVMVNEYLSGVMVSDLLVEIRQSGWLSTEDRTVLWCCGNGLRRIHEAGFSLIDAQPANCMWVPDRRQVYFLDLEYATRRDERGWDLTLFLAFIGAQLSGRLEAETKQLVLQGYWDKNPRRGPVEAPILDEYRPVFQAILDLRQGAV